MLPTQWSEIQGRFRRFLRTVGTQTLAADEIISPVVLLDHLGEPPYRSDPRGFCTGLAVGGAAGAGNLNMVSIELNLTAQLNTCALIFRAHIHAREQLATGFHEAAAWIGQAAGTGNGAPLLEPARIAGAAPDAVAVRCGTDLTGSSPANSTLIAAMPILEGGAGNARLYGADFDFTESPILLVPAALTGGSAETALWLSIIANSSGGVDAVDVFAHFSGVIFNTFQPR